MNCSCLALTVPSAVLGVTVMWVAEAYLDGRRVGEVDDLVSRAQTTYPVAELRTVLTG